MTVVLKDKARPWDQARSNYSSETPKWVTLLATNFSCDDVAKEIRGYGWEIAIEQGGPYLIKINCDQFRLLFAFAAKWVERNYGLKDHLTLRLLLYFYRKNRLSAVTLLQK